MCRQGLMLALLLLLVPGNPARATWIGEGEVEGEVLSAQRRVGGGVEFRLAILTQRIFDGPQVGPSSTFYYTGPDELRISRGDRVLLIVHGRSGSDVRVAGLTFLVDRPGVPLSPGMVSSSDSEKAGSVEVFFRSGRGVLLSVGVVFALLILLFVLIDIHHKRSAVRKSV